MLSGDNYCHVSAGIYLYFPNYTDGLHLAKDNAYVTNPVQSDYVLPISHVTQWEERVINNFPSV